jgi:hypothetical protein
LGRQSRVAQFRQQTSRVTFLHLNENAGSQFQPPRIRHLFDNGCRSFSFHTVEHRSQAIDVFAVKFLGFLFLFPLVFQSGQLIEIFTDCLHFLCDLSDQFFKPFALFL